MVVKFLKNSYKCQQQFQYYFCDKHGVQPVEVPTDMLNGQSFLVKSYENYLKNGSWTKTDKKAINKKKYVFKLKQKFFTRAEVLYADLPFIFYLFNIKKPNLRHHTYLIIWLKNS